jgi:pilus assembly protein CpaC
MKSRSGSLIISLAGAIGLFALGLMPAVASNGPKARQVALTLNAGETYVIKNLSKNGTPAVHVVDNPNALIVHSEAPGQLLVVGAAAGKWSIDVKTADGEAVTYTVSVQPAASAAPLAAGEKAPSAKSVVSGSSAKPATAALDAGSGPVTSESPTASAVMASAPPAATETAAPAAGTAALTASAVGATAPAAPEAATSSAPAGASAPVKVADNTAPSSTSGVANAPASVASAPSAGPAASAPMAEPSAPIASASAAPMAVTASAPPQAVAQATSGPVIPSQAAPSAEQLPAEKFKSDPLAVPAPSAVAGASGTHFLPEDTVLMSAGSSHIYDFARRIRRISVADTDVVDLQVINPYQINLIAHKPGFTTLAVWDNQGRYEEREVRVDPFGKQQVLLNVIVAELDRGRMEQQGVNWTAAMPNQGISLVGIGPGGVATPYSPTSTLTASTLIGAGTANQALIQSSATGTLPPQGQLIPMLLSPNLNYGIAAGNQNFQTQTFFQFLENHNLGKILAEPHLLANSGEKAEFLSGGEIPIVIAQALNTSIVFKQFGTSVIFVPTVVGKDDIELEVKPEVSQPDFAHGVNMFGFTVPAFVTRRAQTLVRLHNNQTLIIAGLILHTKTSEVNKTPYLGDVPYLGALFKHTSYNDTETDLVMSVTPQMVQPLPSNGTVALPTERRQMTPEEIRTERTEPDASRPRF